VALFAELYVYSEIFDVSTLYKEENAVI